MVGLNRMFTGGTIWILAHGHLSLFRCARRFLALAYLRLWFMLTCENLALLEICFSRGLKANKQMAGFERLHLACQLLGTSWFGWVTFHRTRALRLKAPTPSCAVWATELRGEHRVFPFSWAYIAYVCFVSFVREPRISAFFTRESLAGFPSR